MKQKLFTLLTLLVLCVTGAWADGTITAAATSDLGSGNTPRYVVEEAGVGRLMKNKTGGSAWSLSNTSYLQTSSSLFALQTYNNITEIIVHGYGTGNGRAFSKLEVGTTTSNYAEVSATGSGTMSGTASDQTITITPSSTISANSYVAITLTGNINIASVELVYAPSTAAEAPTFSPNGGAINGGSTVSLSSDALKVYYQWSATEVDLTTASEGWTLGTSVSVPNENGINYLYAYATNGTGLESSVVHKEFTITAVSKFTWGLTQSDLTTSTGIATTTTYTGSNASFAASSAAMSGSSSTRSLKNGTTSLTAAATACQRNNLCSGASDFVEDSYYAFTITPAAGYKLSISEFNGDLYYDSGRSGKYKFAIYSGGSKIWEASSSDYVTIGGNNNSQKTLDVSNVEALQSLTGPIQVRMVWYQNGTSSYVALKDFNIEASLEEISGTLYTVTTSVNNTEYGSVTPTNNYIEGSNATITATPNSGYAFVNWIVDGVDGGTTNPLILTNVTEPHTVVANFKQLYSVSFNVASENKGTSTVGFDTQYANVSDKWKAATNYYVAKEGYTLTKWNDGENDYVPGTEYTLTGNITIAPVFTENTVSLDNLTEATTVSWPFGNGAGAPDLSSEGNTQYYVKQTTIAGTSIDVPIFVNTTQDYGISGKKGKFNNSGNAGYAQVNAGTVFKIPAANGMVVKYMTNQTTAVANIGFTDDANDLGGDGSALTAPTVISSDNKTISYTYTGTADYLYLVDVAGGKYPTGISVTYPEVKTKYLTPTITVGDFNFENKGYEVTITTSEGDLYVAEGGGNDFIAKASPYTTYATATTHYYAKAKGSDYGDSDVADEQVENAFDGTKAYVAWVYESNYNNYNIANDEIYKGLATVYNVVPVDIKDYKSAITDEQKTALNGNLEDADLVVLSEAAAGASKAVIAMKDLVGKVPMLNMKLFSYSNNRWGWGTPQNLGTAVADVTITPVSKYYKVLEGVTFDGNNVALFSYPNDDQNHIQYVNSWTAEPAGDVVLANVTVLEDNKPANKPAMHASTTQKYFALGLSCDDFGKYNANVVTLIKNAAAMLIAGENLAAVTAVEGTIKANKEWITFCSTENLDFSSDITGLDGAYTITAHADKATTLTATKMTGAVKAGTGLLLRAAEKKDVDQVIAIPVAATGDEQTGNMLIGVTKDTAIQPSEGDYTNLGLSNGEFHPYSEAGTLAAGKAYLRILTAQMPTAGNNAKLIIVFDGEATGIANLNVNDNDNIDANAPMYNLAGQRVNKSYKGVVIVNGKKVVRK